MRRRFAATEIVAASTVRGGGGGGVLAPCPAPAARLALCRLSLTSPLSVFLQFCPFCGGPRSKFLAFNAQTGQWEEMKSK